VNLESGDVVGGGAGEVTAEVRERMDGVETEAKQRLWLWTLVAILVLVIVESMLGASRGREGSVA
jgi:H+/Cl- antiporter ClcA